VWANKANSDFGILELSGNDADNDGTMLWHGWNDGFARFGTAPTDKVWFECRFSKASIADNALAFFIGLSEVGTSAVATILTANTGVPLSTEDFVGLSCLCADGDIAECIYQEGSATRVNVADMNSALVATTKYKFGMKYRGGAGTNMQGELVYYLNGAEIATLNVTDSLSFPDTNHLAMVCAAQVGAASESKFELDWWRVAAVGGNT
jgi:hypothetical protein